LLIGDDVGGLLAQPPVLLLRLHDRLLELHLRIGPLVERPGQLGRHVLPPAPQDLEHGRRLLLRHVRWRRRRRDSTSSTRRTSTAAPNTTTPVTTPASRRTMAPDPVGWPTAWTTSQTTPPITAVATATRPE